MRLQPIIDRLTAQCPLLVKVAAATSITAIDDIGTDIPAAFVHSVNERAGSNQLDGIVYQQIGNQFAVQIVAGNLGTIADPLDIAEPLEDVRDEIRTALLGWQGTYESPVEFVQGEVLDVTRSVLWWRDIYTFDSFYRS